MGENRNFCTFWFSIIIEDAFVHENKNVATDFRFHSSGSLYLATHEMLSIKKTNKPISNKNEIAILIKNNKNIVPKTSSNIYS